LALVVAAISVAGVARAEYGFGIALAYGLPKLISLWRLPCDSNPGTWRDAVARGKSKEATVLDRVRNAPSDGVVSAKAKKQ